MGCSCRTFREERTRISSVRNAAKSVLNGNRLPPFWDVSFRHDLINVRFGPLCGLTSDISRGPRSAKNGLMHGSKRYEPRWFLFDHLLGAHQDSIGNGDAENFCCF
jgi:hypothetical protein